MKKTVLMLAALVLLAGCEGELEKQIRERASDPQAVQFKDKIVNGSSACISVNAKNAFGGYVGFKRVKMERLVSGDGSEHWVKVSEDEPCTAEGLARDEQMRERDQKLSDVEEAKVLKVLKEAKLIPATAKGVPDIKDPECQKATQSAFTYAGMAVSEKYIENRADWSDRRNRILEEFKKGSCSLPAGLN